MPMNLCNSVFFSCSEIAKIALILSLLGFIPCALKIYPAYSASDLLTLHFLSMLKRSPTSSVFFTVLDEVSLGVFVHFLPTSKCHHQSLHMTDFQIHET